MNLTTYEILRVFRTRAFIFRVWRKTTPHGGFTLAEVFARGRLWPLAAACSPMDIDPRIALRALLAVVTPALAAAGYAVRERCG
jgi:hypothetical protein